jgi:CheY-like chemotaxis protein
MTTVLCVDDYEVALHARKLVLVSAGYSVLVTSDPASALELFVSNAVDLVITDHFLQGSTGTELAASMKKLKPKVPIVIISGLVETPAGMEHADLFIPKTDSPVVVLQKIGELLKPRSEGKSRAS